MEILDKISLEGLPSFLFSFHLFLPFPFFFSSFHLFSHLSFLSFWGKVFWCNPGWPVANCWSSSLNLSSNGIYMSTLPGWGSNRLDKHNDLTCLQKLSRTWWDKIYLKLRKVPLSYPLRVLHRQGEGMRNTAHGEELNWSTLLDLIGGRNTSKEITCGRHKEDSNTAGNHEVTSKQSHLRVSDAWVTSYASSSLTTCLF